MKQRWQQELINQMTSPEALIRRLGLDMALLPEAEKAVKLFPLKVTESYLARIQPGDVDDPLLRQILPLGIERQEVAGFVADPLGEKNSNPIPGLLHKYRSRVLLTLSANCAIHCRYCFRRHFAYADNSPGRGGWQSIFSYIESHQSINEVILSGGDPLSVSDKTLDQFTQALRNLTQIKRLRIHTRIPVVLPSRISDQFLQWLETLHIPCVLVLHINHANEVNDEIKAVVNRIKQTGTTVLNQSVLLRGVNDSVAALENLSEALFAAGVLPYYLFLLDRVQGAHHFEVPYEDALVLYQQLQARLPGFLLPRLAKEEEGATSKTLI